MSLECSLPIEIVAFLEIFKTNAQFNIIFGFFGEFCFHMLNGNSFEESFRNYVDINFETLNVKFFLIVPKQICAVFRV